jgi:DNA polymerase I
MRPKQIVVADFEYECEVGGLPHVLCLVAHVLDSNLQHVQTVRMWRDDFGREPPFDIGDDTLFVAYSAWAEMTCFKQLGWKFPKHIFDLHTAYLAASNFLMPYDPDLTRKKQRKRLPDACRAYGIHGWEAIDKEDISKSIGEGTWTSRYSQQDLINYCEEDVLKSVELFKAQLAGAYHLPPADFERVLWWSEYSAKAVALIQARGIPIDMPLWNLVQENLPAVVRSLLEKYDPSHFDEEPIYSPHGEWSYARFEAWLVRTGIPYWPRLPSGALDLNGDAFRLMYPIHPAIKELHALRDSLGFIVKARLPIGLDGRNRPSLFPFATATGRNAHAKSPYNAHAAVRGFIRCPEGSHIAYLDWRSQEVGIAAYESQDQQLLADYAAGDVYHGLADMCGLTSETDPVKWKKANKAQRDQMKPLQLGITYGMSVRSLALGLNKRPVVASHILDLHQQRYSQQWAWRENKVQLALLDRKIESCFGWPLRISNSPNKRTLYNFPMQSSGAEMLRLAAVRLCEAGIVPIMLIHDGILFEETDPQKFVHAKEIMLQAGRDVCGGFEIGVDNGIAPLKAGDRYADQREEAIHLWSTMMDALDKIGVRKREEP